MSDKTRILDARQIEQKIQRIAHQICETHHDENEIVVVGVAKRGYLLAQRITTLLNDIAPFQVRLVELVIDKEMPLDSDVEFDITVEEVEDRAIILVDDVLNSGRTLMHAARHILQAEIKKMTTVVLVDRRHRKFPIRADFVGLTLSTTLQEHIQVAFSDSEDDAVYLI